MHKSTLFLSQYSTLSLSFLFQLFGQVFTCWVGITEILMHCESLSPPPSSFSAPPSFTQMEMLLMEIGNFPQVLRVQWRRKEHVVREILVHIVHASTHKLIHILIIHQILISLISFSSPLTTAVFSKNIQNILLLIYAIYLVFLLFAFHDKLFNNIRFATAAAAVDSEGQN